MLSPASLDIVRQGVSKIAAATVSPPRHALPPLPPPRTSPVVADGSEGAPFDLGVESPQAHDPLRTQKPALPPRERDVDEAARRAFEQSAAEAADAAIVAGLRREGQLREQVEALRKRRSPVLFYLMAAAACWFVYVRDREGVRWTH